MQTTQINTISCKNGGKGAEWLEWTKYTPTGKEINEKGELYMLVPPSSFINATVKKLKRNSRDKVWSNCGWKEKII